MTDSYTTLYNNRRTRIVDYQRDDAVEVPAHGDIVVFVARVVGILVAFVAVISSVMILMMLRSIVAIFFSNWGLGGITLILFIFLYLIMQCSQTPNQTLWTILRQGA